MSEEQKKEMAVAQADAILSAAGLTTYSKLVMRTVDVVEGIEDMTTLPGAVPARLKKLKAALNASTNVTTSTGK